MCSIRTLVAVVFAFTAFIVALYTNTLQTTPHVLPSLIEPDGGHALVHSERTIEYFLGGFPTGTPVVFYHGAGSTGLSLSKMCEENAKKFQFRFISISCPGWGGTSPIHGRGYFEGAQDALAVLSHLGYGPDERIHIAGVSYGSGTAAALAQLIPHRVKSLQLIVPAWPSMGDFNMWSDSPPLMKLLSFPVIDRIYSYHVSKMDIKLKDALKSFAAEDVALLESVAPDSFDLGEYDYKRSTKYHHEGTCELNSILRNRGHEIYEKREILQKLGNKVSLWFGELDKIVPPPKFLESMLPNARVFRFQLGHLGMLLDTTKYFEEIKRNED